MNVLKQFLGRGEVAAAAVLLGVMLIGSGCSNSGGGGNVAPPPPPGGTSSSTNLAPTKIAVYIPTGDPTDAKSVVVHTADSSEPGSPAKSAMAALVADPESDIPTGTHLLSIDLKDGEATVDFDQVPVDENGGEGKQTRALNAILMTLGQFSSINTVHILVHGSPIKEAGELAVEGSLNVIRPSLEQAQQPGGQEHG